MKEPGEHGRGRGFAVRATDDDGMSAWKKFFFNYFGERTVRQPAVEHLSTSTLPARNRVAHDDKIRAGVRYLGRTQSRTRCPEIPETWKRVIDPSIRAGNPISAFAEHPASGDIAEPPTPIM